MHKNNRDLQIPFFQCENSWPVATRKCESAITVGMLDICGTYQSMYSYNIIDLLSSFSVSNPGYQKTKIHH